MAQLRQDFDKFVERDTEIVVVGPEGADKFQKYFSENDLPFTGLPDPKHKVLKLYKQQVKIFKLGRMPAQTMVDKDGVVQYVHFGHSMQDIPDNAEMLKLIDGMNANAEKAT